MTRRHLIARAAGGAAALAAAQDAPSRAFFELRYFYMRNSKTNQVQRTSALSLRAGTRRPRAARASALSASSTP